MVSSCFEKSLSSASKWLPTFDKCAVIDKKLTCPIIPRRIEALENMGKKCGTKIPAWNKHMVASITVWIKREAWNGYIARNRERADNNNLSTKVRWKKIWQKIYIVCIMISLHRNYKDYVYGRCKYRSTWKNNEYLRSKDTAKKWWDVSRHI